MLTIPTAAMTLNTNHGILKLEVHNWCQEITLRNKGGKCLAFSDGTKQSMDKLLSFFDKEDHDKVCLIIFNLGDTELCSKILTFWSKPYEV
ncbi:hypothetical protein CPT_Morttis_199 [Acinetobacter phage Morttis]|nr:hypothetical protein CPT_Maestro_205 [Acinetobacter phage Maestro]QQM18685.1 hypothetical protein CPT_Morttis_199 [Acinetobacter phage Morttis]